MNIEHARSIFPERSAAKRGNISLQVIYICKIRFRNIFLKKSLKTFLKRIICNIKNGENFGTHLIWRCRELGNNPVECSQYTDQLSVAFIGLLIYISGGVRTKVGASSVSDSALCNFKFRVTAIFRWYGSGTEP